MIKNMVNRLHWGKKKKKEKIRIKHRITGQDGETLGMEIKPKKLGEAKLWN